MTFQIRALCGRRSLISTAQNRHFTVAAAPEALLDNLRSESPAAAQLLTVIADDAQAAENAQFNPATVTAHSSTREPAAHPAQGAGQAAGTSAPVVIAGEAELSAALQRAVSAAGVETCAGGEDIYRAVYQAFEHKAVLVWCAREADVRKLVDIDRLVHDFRLSWVPVDLRLGQLLFGPFTRCGEGANYEDFAQRAEAAALDLDVHRALSGPALNAELPEVDRWGAQLDHIAQLLSAGLVPDKVWEYQRSQVVSHTVLAMPDRDVHRPAHEPGELESALCGVITRFKDIVHQPQLPDSLVTVQSEAADLRRVSPWSNTRVCQGSSFNDYSAALLAARGEAAERYCCNILDTLEIRRGSYGELSRSGVPALAPEELVLYSPAQYAAPGFPFVELSRDLVVDWVPAADALTGQEIWVPASLVYVNWYTGARSGQPHTNFCAFAGIAAGPTADFATVNGIEEIIERHATMAWWLNRQPLPEVSAAGLGDGSRLTKPLRAQLEDGEVDVRYLHLENEFAVPVAAAVVRHHADQLVNIGFSARPDFIDAGQKALTEALTLQAGSRDLLDEHGAHWRAMDAGRLSARSYKPYRADRRYLDDFRADFRDVDDLMVQQQVFLDPRAYDMMSDLLAPSAQVQAESLPALPDRSLKSYLDRVDAAGYRVLTVDLTTPDIAACGLRVVRTLIPGTIGNAPAAFPFLGKDAVVNYPVRMGWSSQPKTEDQLNYAPMPHA